VGTDGGVPLRCRCAEGGVQDSFPHKTTFVSSTSKRVKIIKQPERQTVRTAVPRTDTEECHRRDTRSAFWQRILFPSVRCPQTIREMETSDRPQSSESVCKSTKVQDGDSRDSLALPNSRKLLFQYRPTRRLLPHSYTPTIQEVSEDVQEGEGISIQGPSLRSEHQSLDIHAGGLRSETDGSQTRDCIVPLPRRLAGPSTNVQDGPRSVRIPTRTVQVPGVTSQSGEIRTSTHKELRIHRGQIRSGTGKGLSTRQEHSESKTDHIPVHTINLTNCKNVAISIGDAHVPTEICAPGQAIHETCSMGTDGQLVTEVRISGDGDTIPPSPPEVPSLVAGPGRVPPGGPPSVPKVLSQDLHRRLSDRLGRPCREQNISGTVVTGGIGHIHKHPGDEGNHKDPRGTQSSTRISNPSSHRQHHGGGLHQQGRGHTISRADERDSQAIQSSENKEMEDQSQVHPREAQCSGGSAQSKGTGSDHRVVNQTGCHRSSLRQMVQTNDRPVRDQTQLQVSHVHLSSTRSNGTGRGRSLSGSRRKRTVRVSSSSDSAQNSSDVPDDQEMQNDCSSTPVGETGVDTNPEPASNRRAHQDTSLQEPTATTNVRQVPLRPRHAEPARLEARKRHLIQEGYSETIAQRIVAPQSKDSGKCYDGKYVVYEKWCIRQNIQPQKPTMQQVTLFLQYLFEVQKLQYSTIAGYRSMLSSSFKDHTSLDIGHSEILTDLMRSFRRERPPSSHCRPEWDLAFILFSLTRPPFEDITEEGKVNLAHLTWKTAFLILLASGARRGEVHAIKRKSVKFAENKEYVTLEPSPEFVPKSGMKRSHALKPMKIPCLCSVLPEEEREDRSLCPVRCLDEYLKVTDKMRKGKSDRRRLFISMRKEKKGEICKNTLSAWIKKLIQFCYKNPSEDACELTGTRAHDIRGFAHSLTYRGTVAMEDLLQAGSWKSHTVFTSNYLKDLTEIDSEQLLRLGPVVAGQKIVLHAKI